MRVEACKRLHRVGPRGHEAAMDALRKLIAVLPVGIAYAIWATLNVVLFPVLVAVIATSQRRRVERALRVMGAGGSASCRSGAPMSLQAR
jgi:hypothetical protein